ncbi:hypothetical protein HDA32_002821 [Spinactinospora alkalitolerans]|uniref:Uncharacterized protein n=1 Tax=Spinactinospora alkalitolerans TaxID=687207 RepID=A0A852TVH6_9ACTN|nr:hypothetical protein [Spinactinospora alkalitolerans]NYE47701.1 hypothetical protein [Spinactinospora alkalitolerans]
MRARENTAPAAPERPRAGRPGRWRVWAPYAALAWSIGYALIAAYWAWSGTGFPYTGETARLPGAALLGRFGPSAAWTAVVLLGLPMAVVAAAMLRGARTGRPALTAAGCAASALLLLAMTDVNLLAALGYVPYGVYGLTTGAPVGEVFVNAVVAWPIPHQYLCVVGGFLWLMATVAYARRTGDACMACGRRSGTQGWTAPASAARWGRVAAYVAAVIPVLYAVSRYAWALGIPLGISEDFLRQGREQGAWTSGAFLATFGVVGAILTLGLVQRWGEVFPRWMVGLAGRRVPISLAVVPASIVSVLVTVGGIGMWSGFARTVTTDSADWMAVAPALPWPLWGVALAAATLAYHLRRRGACRTCGRGGEQAEAAVPDEAAV